MDDLWGANSYARRRSRVNRRALRDKLRFDYDLAAMRDLLVLFIHLVVTTVRLVRPAGARAIVAESLLLKQQLPVVTRSRRRAPDLRPQDRFVVGLCAGLMQRARLHCCAIVLKLATILRFQRLLIRRKYGELFSPKRCGRPGPKGPSAELTTAGSLPAAACFNYRWQLELDFAPHRSRPMRVTITGAWRAPLARITDKSQSETVRAFLA